MIEAVGPVAVVNGKEIPAERFNAQVSPMNGEFRRAGLPEPMLRQIADQILDGLIDAHLIERQLAVNSVWVSDAEVDAEFERLKAEFEGGTKTSTTRSSSRRAARLSRKRRPTYAESSVSCG